MRHFTIICAGFAWSVIALMLHLGVGALWSDIPVIFPKFAIAGVLTSYAVTALFWKHLGDASSPKKYFLPVATISCGVSIWSVLIFVIAAGESLIVGRNDIFDGIGYYIPLAIIVSLTVALPITYPAAYFTQTLIARYGKTKSA